MRVIIALKLIDEVPHENCDYIGADKGALFLAQNNIHMISSIGDFDSIKEDDLKLVKSFSDEVVCLNPIKNDSDSEAALKLAINKGYDEIEMWGAFGGRVDHTYYNFQLAYQYPNCLKLKDSNNLVYCLKEGTYQIQKKEYTYISFFTNEEAIISLNGFEYSLDNTKITKDDLYTLSNSIVDKEATLTIKKGKVLVLQTKDA